MINIIFTLKVIFYSGGETVESSCEGFKSSEQQKDGEVKQKRGKKERMKARKLEIKRGERVSKKKERRENREKEVEERASERRKAEFYNSFPSRSSCIVDYI